MDIAYVFDENFAACAAVSITSLLENHRNVTPVRFFVFDSGISMESKEKIIQLCSQYGATVNYINVQPILKYMEELKVTPWRGRYSVYVKLMVSGFLPKDVQRLIVLDADTVITGSIYELCTMDLHGHPCAMALEGIPGNYNMIAGIGKSELYNTGVIVYDLSAWREKKVEERFIHHLTHIRSFYMLPEEDPISIVLKGDVERLDAKYNFNAVFFYYGNAKYYRRFSWHTLGDKFYSLSQLEASRKDIRVHHCTDTFTRRPWFKDNIHPYTSHYDKYLALTPWKDTKKQEESMSMMSNIEYLFRKYLPKAMSDYEYYIACKLFYTFKAKKYYCKGRDSCG